MTGLDPHPHLGFNPAPGNAEKVETLLSKLISAADALGEAHHMVKSLSGNRGTAWQGEAAEAFHQRLNGKLSTNLMSAQQSLEKAALQLKGWHSDLVGFQERARHLDDEVGRARAVHQKAKMRYQSCQASPDLKLAGQTFDTRPQLNAAQLRLDTANFELRQAAAALDSAQEELDDLLKSARDLEADHADTASTIADRLREATEDLAPEGPGWFSNALHSVGDAIKSALVNSADVFAFISAAAGFAALFGGPLAPALLIIAGGASLLAFAGHAMGEEGAAVRKGLAGAMRGDTEAVTNMNFLSGAVSLTGDALGAVPGISTVARGASNAVQGARAAGEGASLTAQGAKASKSFPGEVMHIARNTAEPGTVLDKGIALSGISTATPGMLETFGVQENKTVNEAGTFIDTGRSIGADGKGTLDSIKEIWRVVPR